MAAIVVIHVRAQLVTSNNPEVYDSDGVSSARLEELCGLRQPLMVTADSDIVEAGDLTTIAALVASAPTFELQMRAQQSNSSADVEEKNISVPISVMTAQRLLGRGTHGNSNSNINSSRATAFLSEGNEMFLEESGLDRVFSRRDRVLRPRMLAGQTYDLILGSQGATTPLRYTMSHRNFYTASSGAVDVKLAPPRCAAHLMSTIDAHRLRGEARLNPWIPAHEMNHVRCLDVRLEPGRMLFVPAYWWVSFSFVESGEVNCFHYRTYPNLLAVFPTLCLNSIRRFGDAAVNAYNPSNRIEDRLLKTVPPKLHTQMKPLKKRRRSKQMSPPK